MGIFLPKQSNNPLYSLKQTHCQSLAVISGLGYSRKKSNRGDGEGWGHTFLKTPLKFFIFHFTPGNSRQSKAPPLEIPRNCVRCLRSSKPKNEDPWKFNIIFFWSSLWEIPLRFQLNPGNSTSYSFNNPGNSISQPIIFGFFLE